MTIETTTAHSQLAQQTPALPVVTAGDMPGLAVLQQWADANDNATRLVAQWIFTDLVPLHHWPNPVGMTLKTWPNPRLSPNGESEDDYRRRCQIATASASGTVLRGIALGLSPNIALEQMHSIHGKIGMMTKLKYALAIKHKVKVWDVELSEESVTCAGIHPLTGETVEITITMAQAVKAKWLENAAYEKTPIDMLWARAMSRVLDRVAGHVLFGLASIEDVDPEPDEQGEATVTNVTAQDIKARVARPAAPAIEPQQAAGPTRPETAPAAPAPDPPTAAAVPPADLGSAEELIDLSQNRRLHALLRKLDLGQEADRAVALKVISYLVERPIESTKLITKAEAGPLLDSLDALSKRPEEKWRAEIRFMVTPDSAGQLPMPEGGDRG